MRHVFSILAAVLLFGGAVVYQAPTAQEAVVSPEVLEVLGANPELRLYEVITGTTLWDLAGGMYGQGVNWPYIYGWNVRAGLMPVGAFKPQPGERPYHVAVKPGDLLVLASDVAAGVPEIVRPYTVATVAPVAPVSPSGAEEASTGLNWWMWIAIVALISLVYAVLKSQESEKKIAELREQVKGLFKQRADDLTRYEHNLAENKALYDRRLAELTADYELRLEEQRDIDLAARRSNMPPLPDGVRDDLMAGPPVRYEGVTEGNRGDVFQETAREMYTQLHPGASTDGLVFKTKNERRVLVSSRPGETFEVTFGDNGPREVTLVREPGWICDVEILRNGELIQELKDVCVLGFCANRIWRRMWIVGALVEPFEYAAVHSVPDWEAVRVAEQARRQQLILSAGSDGRIVAFIGDDPVLETPCIALETTDAIAFEDGVITVGERTRLASAPTAEPLIIS